MVLVDVHTRHLWAYGLKRKKEAYPTYEEWKAYAEKQTGFKLQQFQDDKGGEYIGHKWEASMKRDGVEHRKTTPDTPQSNGIGERVHGTLIAGVTCMLAQAKLPAACWLLALAVIPQTENIKSMPQLELSQICDIIRDPSKYPSHTPGTCPTGV